MRSLPWTLALLSLAAWLGAGSFAAFVVAPAAFAVLPSRSLAGDLNGRVFETLGIELSVASALFLVAVVLIRRQEEIPVAKRLLLTRLPFLSLAAAVVGRWIVAPRMQQLREAMPFTIDQLPPNSPLREQFGKLHGMSSALLVVSLAAGLACLFLLASEIARRSSEEEPELVPPPGPIRLDSPLPPPQDGPPSAP
jgi:hypothetical protein